MNQLTITSIIILAVVALAAIAYYAFGYLKKKLDRKRFINKVDELVPRINQALEELDELFRPDRLATTEDEINFEKEHKKLVENITTLCNENEVYSDVLTECGIYDSLSALTSIHEKRMENNNVYTAIEEMKQIAEEGIAWYKKLTSPHRYFAFSEKEKFLLSLSRFEELSKIVLPQYSSFIKDDLSKDLIAIKKCIEQDREAHNKDFIDRELAECKTYFDTVLGTYPLDPQQRDSIVKLEDNCLVIASAGSGKTSTILGKAKYLVEKRNIAPSRVLLITYTRKAATELHERMQIEGMTCSTFHALAYQIIAQVTGQAPSICDADLPLNVFHKLILEDKEFLHAVNYYIMEQQSMMGLEHDYDDAFSYFEDRKKYGIQALFRDIDGKIIFTRSEEEKRIATILTRLGVPFRYENGYQYNTTTPERRQYRPDFTIYYPDGNGGWKWLYLEHYAINDLGQVPRWFGEGTRGGWYAANQKYLEGIEWKRATHRRMGTILIETTSANFRDGTVEEKIRQQLERYGVPIKERTDDELYDLLVTRNRKLEKSVYTLITSFITLMKANEKSIDKMIEELESATPEDQLQDTMAAYNRRNLFVLKNVIKPFFVAYEEEMALKYEIDFTDAIIQATEICRNGLWKPYEYILVDEFQDISIDRYKFLQALRSESPKTKLYCVGDDWQSIFRFAGSDMSLVYDFEKYFGYTEQCKIETTYRFHQPLIEKSSDFVMKNKEQKKKTIMPPKGDRKNTYLDFVKCESDDEGVLRQVESIVRSIPADQSILLLGRYNYDAMSVGFTGKIDMKDSRIRVKILDRELTFLSVHSAKGLEADHVILVNCNQGAYGFPSLIEDDPILDFVLSKSETYPFAEERRLFYVAMTRAKMRMYVLYDAKKPSPFISEFMLNLEVGSYLCPRCLEGKMESIKDGVAANGTRYRSFICSNHEGGCDFFETKYGNLTPPGIRIAQDMTAQDIERIRESRRMNSNQRVSSATRR